MNLVYDRKENCSGCTCCENVCPVNAIEMLSDHEGFKYPKINEDICIDCFLCKESCPNIHHEKVKEEKINHVYAVKHIDENVRRSSTSGGAFTAISDYFIENNGVVYGADIDENFYVFHNRATTKEDRDRFKTSKYIQSDLNAIYKHAKKDLDSNKLVLFTGTPCQTAGIRSYLKDNNNNSNLYTCCIICYGVPSPMIFHEYINYLEDKYDDKVEKVLFRNKLYPWKRRGIGKNFMFKTKNRDSFIIDEGFSKLMFEQKAVIRPSCYECKFTDVKRPADITIADYWGIERYFPSFYDKLGVSLVITHNLKGDELFNKISKDFVYQERDIQESLNEQIMLSKPVSKPDNREEFWKEVLNGRFCKVLE